MHLNVNEDLYLEDPSLDVIRQQVELLQADQYAILQRADEFYVQTYRGSDGTYQLEYRAGSKEKHFRTSSAASVDDVAQAFIRFASGLDDWQNLWTWKKLDFDELQGDIVG